jgi:rubrerythrin
MYPIITTEVKIQPIISNEMNHSGQFDSIGKKVSADTQFRKTNPESQAMRETPAVPWMRSATTRLTTSMT